MLDPLVTCCVNAIAASSTLSLVLNRQKLVLTVRERDRVEMRPFVAYD